MALKDVIGQDKAVNIILRTLSRGRVPSAYLFAGESGIGKRFTALNLAKAVNCEKAADSRQSSVGSQQGNEKISEGLSTGDYQLLDCCDTCLSCKKIDSNTHPDLLLISPEKGEIRIDEVRAVEEALLFKPYEGRKKVVIVDDGDMMNQSAANALLKTLEEPPDESLLILVTANPYVLPETIRSRCSRLNFVPLPYEACERVIKAVSLFSESARARTGASSRQSAVNRLATDDCRLATAIRLSMGRPGLAISSDILDERERFISLFRGMLNDNNETWAGRDEMEHWFDEFFIFMRDMAAVKVADESNSDDRDILINSDIGDFISEMAGKTKIRDIINVYYKMAALKAKLDFNLNKALTWNYASSILKKAMGYI